MRSGAKNEFRNFEILNITLSGRTSTTAALKGLTRVNFKRRIATIAWRASSSISPSAQSQAVYNTVYRPTFGAPAGQPSPCAGIPALPSTLLTMPRQLPSPTELSPSPQHFASRQAPRLPRFLRAEPKINGCLSDASLDKQRFALKAQVLQEALPPPPPWLAHLCSLTHTLPPLPCNLCSLCQSGHL